MKGFAIHNAPTDHGGIIPATQMRSSQMGNLFVVAGDGHFCPKCKTWSTVIKSHDHVIFDGKPVAYVGDKLTCGARILPQQTHVVGSSGSAYYGSTSPILRPINSDNNLTNSLVDSQEAEEVCYCNKEITLELLDAVLPKDVLSKGLFFKSAYPGIKNLDKSIFLKSLNKAMEKYEINTCLRKAHFLAQIACEGDMFRTTEEYKNNDGSIPSHWEKYSGGPLYHGRGLIQLTHDYNYEKYGAFVGVKITSKNLNFVASDPDHILNSAVWFWLKGSAWGNGNKFADKDDVHYLTMLVNGGFNHYCSRKNNAITLIKKMKIKELCEKAKGLGNTLGVYSFNNSALTKTKVGPTIWKRYQTKTDLKKHIACES